MIKINDKEVPLNVKFTETDVIFNNAVSVCFRDAKAICNMVLSQINITEKYKDVNYKEKVINGIKVSYKIEDGDELKAKFNLSMDDEIKNILDSANI